MYMYVMMDFFPVDDARRFAGFAGCQYLFASICFPYSVRIHQIHCVVPARQRDPFTLKPMAGRSVAAGASNSPAVWPLLKSFVCREPRLRQISLALAFEVYFLG